MIANAQSKSFPYHNTTDPSLESISLAKTIDDMTLRSGLAFKGVVINKYNSVSQQELIENRLTVECVPIIGSLGFTPALQDACLGEPLANFNKVNQIGLYSKKITKWDNR